MSTSERMAAALAAERSVWLLLDGQMHRIVALLDTPTGAAVIAEDARRHRIACAAAEVHEAGPDTFYLVGRAEPRGSASAAVPADAVTAVAAPAVARATGAP